LRGRHTPVVGLLFTGQGAQYAGMARELYDSEAVYRDMFDRCSAAIGRDLNKIFADDEALTRTRNTQPALGALTLSVAALWRSWGITPAAVAGHSVGEIAAAAFAGCLSIEDAMGLLATRGELMDSLPDGGAMAAVKAGEDRVVPFLADGVSLAGLNHPEETVISGDSAAIDATLAALPGDIEARPLRVSHAFHSACMDPILDRWEDAVAAIDWRAPSLPLVSSLTGAPIEDTDPAFWRRHAREPVRFMEALNALIATGCDTFIEVGPHPVLLGMGQRITDDPSLTWLPSLRRKVDARQAMLEALGAYWVRGGEVDWTAVDGPRGPRVALPPYPFARQRHWLDHDRYAAASATWTVRWAPPTAPTEPLPAAIRVVGTSDLREAIEAELTRAGCTVSATAAAVLDLRPLAHTDLEALCADLLTDAGHDGPHWMVTRGAQIDTRTPQAAAVWGLARCLFLERPMTRGGLIDIDTDTTAAAIVDAMGRATDGIAIRERPLTPTLVPFRSSDDTPSLDGRWLITGGLGSLGLQVADWLADRGVQSLVLTSRRGLPDDPEDARVVAVQALRERGVDVQAAAVDTTDQEAMRALLTPSIRGILHLAGTTTPQAIDDIDPETVAETLAPKIRGAAILDALTEDMELDAFVMFGSIAGVWGSRELSAYAAGNAFLGALARNRRQRGLKALTVHWGPWSGGGMVDAEREARLRRMGLDPIQPREALRTLGCLLTRDEPEVVIAPVRWRDFLSLYEVAGQRPFFDRVRPKQSAPPSPLAPPLPTPPEPADTEAVLRTHVREVLRLPSDRPLPIDAPLLEFGFDSLMATELRTTLLQAGVDVPLGRLLGGPSIEELLIMARARQAPQDRDASPETPEDMPSFLIWSHAAAAIVGAAIATGLFVLLQRMVWP
jgi:malonyl CoA-acyl carrier protein transacylase/aryl carrier-like protein